MTSVQPFTPGLAGRAATLVPESADEKAASVPFELVLSVHLENLDQPTEAPAQVDGQTLHAAAIHPEIGGRAKAFQASPLLVETALLFSQNSGPPTQEVDPRFIEPAAASQDGIPQAHEHFQVQPREDFSERVRALVQSLLMENTGQVAPAAFGAKISPSTSEFRSHGNSQSVQTGTTAHRPGEVTPTDNKSVSASRGERAAETRDARIHGRRLGSAGGHQARMADVPSIGSSIFLRLLPVEGGFRMLVRLNKLPDALRAELEARLRELFDEFGLMLRDIEFRETGV